MAAANSSVRIACEPLVVAPPWEAWSIGIGAFPVDVQQREFLAKALTRLGADLSAVAGPPRVFLQHDHLHVDGGASRFASCARDWSPSLGLGIFPGCEPPSTWTSKDFEGKEPGDTMRPMCHKAFLLGAPPSVAGAAWEAMFGSGVTLQIYAGERSTEMLNGMRDLYLPTIQAKIFRRYPFFVTLLDRKLLESASEDQLELWSSGFSAYVRESAEDLAILVVSRIPLSKAMESAGLGRIEAH